MGAAAIRKLMADVGQEVASMPEPWVRALTPYLGEARATLARDVARWVKREGRDGGQPFTMMRYRRALAELHQGIAAVRETLPAQVASVIGRGGEAAGRLAVKHLERSFELFHGEARPLPFRPAAVLAQGQHMLAPKFAGSVATYGHEGIVGIQRELVLGTLRGETFDELTTRLARRGGSISVTGGTITDGLFEAAGSRWRAERLVRTEMINAYAVNENLSIRALNVDDPGWIQRWDAAWDRVCAVCAKLDGVTAEVDGVFLDGYAHPPAHPNCRCALMAWRAEWSDELRRAA